MLRMRQRKQGNEGAMVALERVLRLERVGVQRVL